MNHKIEAAHEFNLSNTDPSMFDLTNSWEQQFKF